MLHIKRAIGQGLLIGKDIKVILLDIDLKTFDALLGIDAPRDLAIIKEEVYEKNNRRKKEIPRKA